MKIIEERIDEYKESATGDTVFLYFSGRVSSLSRFLRVSVWLIFASNVTKPTLTK